MLNGEIAPTEWKAQGDVIGTETFEFELDADTKATLIADYNGYATKEDFIEAYEADDVAPFTDYAEITEALRA